MYPTNNEGGVRVVYEDGWGEVLSGEGVLLDSGGRQEKLQLSFDEREWDSFVVYRDGTCLMS